MKIALKYGISVAFLIAVWVAFKHFVLHLEGNPAQFADVAVFNLSAIVGLVLGIREKRALNGGWLKFLDGWKTGISIAVTYSILTALYFAVMLAVVGPKMMQQEGETSYLKRSWAPPLGLLFLGPCSQRLSH